MYSKDLKRNSKIGGSKIFEQPSSFPLLNMNFENILFFFEGRVFPAFELEAQWWKKIIK